MSPNFNVQIEPKELRIISRFDLSFDTLFKLTLKFFSMEFGKEIMKYQIQPQTFEHGFEKCILKIIDCWESCFGQNTVASLVGYMITAHT